MFNLSKIFKKSSDDVKQNHTETDVLKNKYSSFQKLLSTNNEVLELMADMEEKLSGEFLFDIHYIKTTVRILGNNVLKIIDNLNVLTKDKYTYLLNVHQNIYEDIEKILEYKMDIPVSDLVIPLEDLTVKSVGIAGGKIANLGEVRNSVHLPTPQGFVISAYAFVKFMDHNRLIEKISDRLSSLSIENLEELNKFSNAVYHMIIASNIPADLQEAIENAYAKLCKEAGEKTKVSVRSSAIREDSEFSFAGQYATFLNVPGDMIMQKYKEVVASLFTPRALFYSKTKGFSAGDMVMSVGVLGMVDALTAGVMYSRDPNNSDAEHILINAVHGLGLTAVDGTVTPDLYTVSRHPAGTILGKTVSEQEKMLVCGQNGNLIELLVPDGKRGKQCLPDEQIRLLAEYATVLEKHYSTPQDIEWAVGSDKKIYILQSRPLKIFTQHSASSVCIPTRFPGYNIILDKGVIACKGVGFGKVFVLKDEEDLEDFPQDAILVAKHTSPKFVTVMNKASAIVTDVGSPTGHMASLSREYQVPTILDTEISTVTLKSGQEITVDAINCNIYEGRVNELLEYASKKKEPFKDTHLFKTLEKALKWVVPLNLTDPDSGTFRPEFCKTYHDITRFAHEIAMHAMFNFGDEQNIEGIKTIDLHAGIPVDVHMLDIDGGVKENIHKASFEDVFSIPFTALLKGMRSMRWPDPPPVDARGFLGMIARAASVTEDQMYETAQRSFVVVSKNYMNFSIRLGYHFSMVESYAGENINNNYIKFFFKGGGAVIDRRLRRVRLIKEILKGMGFKVKVKEDIIDAVLLKYKQSTIEDRLISMGKLTAYTKQLDMALFNDAVADMYIEQFMKEHVKQ
jgi:pyruvate,water dikinase